MVTGIAAENESNFVDAEDHYERSSRLGNMEAKYRLGILIVGRGDMFAWKRIIMNVHRGWAIWRPNID